MNELPSGRTLLGQAICLMAVAVAAGASACFGVYIIYMMTQGHVRADLLLPQWLFMGCGAAMLKWMNVRWPQS